MSPMQLERLARLWEDALGLVLNKSRKTSEASDAEVEEGLVRLWEPCFACDEVSAPDRVFTEIRARLSEGRASSTSAPETRIWPKKLAKAGFFHTLLHGEIRLSSLARMSSTRRQLVLLAALVLLLAAGYACFLLFGQSGTVPC